MEGTAAISKAAKDEKAWRDFNPGPWRDSIDVRDFIVRNVTSYTGDEKILAAFNLSADAVDTNAPEFADWRQIGDTGLLEGELVRGRLRLPAHGAVFAIPLREAGCV